MGEDYGLEAGADEAFHGELERLAAVGDAVIEYGTGEELLAVGKWQ